MYRTGSKNHESGHKVSLVLLRNRDFTSSLIMDPFLIYYDVIHPYPLHWGVKVGTKWRKYKKHVLCCIFLHENIRTCLFACASST